MAIGFTIALLLMIKDAIKFRLIDKNSFNIKDEFEELFSNLSDLVIKNLQLRYFKGNKKITI